MTTKLLPVLLATVACGPTLEREVSMRPFGADAFARVDAAEPTTPETDVAPSALSSVACLDDQPDCACDLEEIHLSQIFLKDPLGPSNDIVGSLFRDGEVQDAQVLTLHRNTQIGIDIYVEDPDGAREGTEGLTRETREIEGVLHRYVNMQDVPVFSEAHPFDETTLDSSVAYTFAVGARASNPSMSPLGCLMTVVVDYAATPTELAPR